MEYHKHAPYLKNHVMIIDKIINYFLITLFVIMKWYIG